MAGRAEFIRFAFRTILNSTELTFYSRIVVALFAIVGRTVIWDCAFVG